MQIFDTMDFEPKPLDDGSLSSFDPDWEPKIKSNWMGKRKPLNPAVKERCRFLWAKLRVACRQKDLLRDLEIQRDLHLDRNFGLRSAKLQVESDEEIDIDDSKKLETLVD